MQSFFGGFTALLWLAVAVLCLLIEAFTQSLTTIWFALSALVLIFVSLFRVDFALQLLIFALLSLVLLIFTRPLVKDRLLVKKTPTNVDSLIGRKAFVTEAIPAGMNGAVKAGPLVWSARAEDESLALGVGSECVIEKVEGATLVVVPPGGNQSENQTEK